MNEGRNRKLQVGIFMAVGLGALALGIFLIGEKGGLFEQKTTLYVHFEDINGLVIGAPVRLAGLDVGTIRAIEFPEDLEQKEARLTLSIKRRYMNRIRTDSVASIDSKGLLGDKLVNITLGSRDRLQLQDGDIMQTRTAQSLEDLAKRIDQAVGAFTEVSRTAGEVITKVATDDVANDLSRILASVAAIAEEVEQGDGFAHRLIYDETYGDDLGEVFKQSRQTLRGMRTAVNRIDRVIVEVEAGNGTLNELIYGDTGTKAVGEVRDAVGQLNAILTQVRTGEGMLHGLLYDKEDAALLGQLNQLAKRLNRITAEIEKGRGTLGGLLVDPSVYEDLKTILGNVERNVMLKALVRFAVKEGGIERPGRVDTKKSTGATKPAPSAPKSAVTPKQPEAAKQGDKP